MKITRGLISSAIFVDVPVVEMDFLPWYELFFGCLEDAKSLGGVANPVLALWFFRTGFGAPTRGGRQQAETH